MVGFQNVGFRQQSASRAAGGLQPGGSAASSRPVSGLGPYAPLLRLALGFGAVAGFGYGLTVLLALAFRLPLGGAWLALVQVHGQAQLVGFVTPFIVAVGGILFPRFLASPLDRPATLLVGTVALVGGVALRVVGQPLGDSPLRVTLLLASGVFGPVGLGLAAYPLIRCSRRSIQPWSLWRSYSAFALAAFAGATLLHVYASVLLAGGQSLVPFALGEALLHLQLWGFVVPVTLAVGLKIFPNFLILRAPRERTFHPLLALYRAGVALTTAGWLGTELFPSADDIPVVLRAVGTVFEAAALGGFAAAIRLFEPAARPSGTPHITNPTRRWIRLAFAWLLLGALLGAAYAVREALGGAGAGFVGGSVVRHALAMGYLLPLMASMAGRILPVYSADVLGHPWLLPTTVWLLLAGALARVGGELVGGYEPGVAPIVALGGVLSTIGFLLLAGALWWSTTRLPASGTRRA
ncbi:MAG: hypothetical protein M3O34_01485 [Chloroflexota bacterium]|nr:hypothetical protein [Chloroflexota bacterium]